MSRLAILAAAAAFALTSSAALAQEKKAAPEPRTAASIECSKQADAQGLKGKKRKAFRATCKKTFKKAA